MLSNIEKLLLLIADMEEMVNLEDDLSKTILNLKRRKIELNLEDLDLISAAGNNNLNYKKDNDEN